MKTHDYTVDFTDLNEIGDQTTVDPYTGEPVESENDEPATDDCEYDMESIRGLLEALSTKFKTLKAVRPTCIEVENLLLVTGHNSWSDFQRQFKEELNDYFETTVKSEDAPQASREALTRAELKRDKIKEQIKNLEKSIESWKKAKTTLETRMNTAEMEALSTEGMEWDEASHKKHLAAAKTALTCKMQLKQLEAKNPEPNLKRLYTNLRFADGQVKFQEQVLQGNVRVLINTNEPKEDARLYQKLSESCVWEINRLLEQETNTEAKMAEERFSGADFGVARQTITPFESTSGGVYESAVEQLHRIREQLTESFATYAACIAGYEVAAMAFVPRYQNEWFPEVLELETALKQARQRARQASLNRARSQLEAAREQLKR